MPELPEVENVRLSLQALGSVGQRFIGVDLLRGGLRTPFPRGLNNKIAEQTVLSIQRRAKYILFETEKYFLLSHLGMTGSWRVPEGEQREKHDHVILHFATGMSLVFNDPRRFGVLDLLRKEDLKTNRWLRHLGVEPLSEEFAGSGLFEKTRGLKGAIKGFIMDQRRVVGVGNIYASEALFAAAIRPTRPAGRVTQAECNLLAQSIRRILLEAIAAGGSTIRDYRNSQGDDGTYQDRFLIYAREGEPCLRCNQPIKAKFIAGRNSYWCSKCQR